MHLSPPMVITPDLYQVGIICVDSKGRMTLNEAGIEDDGKEQVKTKVSK